MSWKRGVAEVVANGPRATRIGFSSTATAPGGGRHLRLLPLRQREGLALRYTCPRTIWPRLLTRRREAIFISDFEQGEIGPDLFRKACEFGMEELVSKRRDSTYRPVGRRVGLR